MDAPDREYQRYRDAKTCFIPTCSKSDKKNPGLKFFAVRNELKENWCQLVGRNCPKRQILCCEDHLDLKEDLENYNKWIAGFARPKLKLNAKLKNYSRKREKNEGVLTKAQASSSSAVADEQITHTLPNDMENYTQYHVMGSVKQIRMKPGCIPTKFECQPGRRKRTSNTTVRPYIMKKRKKELIEESVRDFEERNALSKHFELGETSTGISDCKIREHDPLSRATDQCRFCGEFSKDCVAVSSDMTYLAGNKTTLAVNDTSVHLDFNHRSLPKAVCRDCDAKLQEFYNFVNIVKAAQGALINVTEEKEDIDTRLEFVETTTEFPENTTDFEEKSEYEGTETLIVKTEYNSQQEYSDEDKEGILDSLTVSETVFVEETHIRKRDTDIAKPKKLQAKEKCNDYFVIAIKEEVVEQHTNVHYEGSDTETDVKPSELELAKSALLFEKVNTNIHIPKDIKVTDKL